jgi:hypothetical protein
MIVEPEDIVIRMSTQAFTERIPHQILLYFNDHDIELLKWMKGHWLNREDFMFYAQDGDDFITLGAKDPDILLWTRPRGS